MTGEPTPICGVCHYATNEPGPWCNLYVVDRYCAPLSRIRRAIYKADAEGDGSMVNALCQYIRVRTNERFVP